MKRLNSQNKQIYRKNSDANSPTTFFSDFNKLILDGSSTLAIGELFAEVDWGLDSNGDSGLDVFEWSPNY